MERLSSGLKALRSGCDWVSFCDIAGWFNGTAFEFVARATGEIVGVPARRPVFMSLNFVICTYVLVVVECAVMDAGSMNLLLARDSECRAAIERARRGCIGNGRALCFINSKNKNRIVKRS